MYAYILQRKTLTNKEKKKNLGFFFTEETAKMSCEEKKRQSSGDSVSEVETTIESHPDNVRCHIMSFLPTRVAAATALISKRWKHHFGSHSVPSTSMTDTFLTSASFPISSPQ